MLPSAAAATGAEWRRSPRAQDWTTSSAPRPEESSQMWNSTAVPGVSSSPPSMSSLLTKSLPWCLAAFSCWISSAGWIQPYFPFQSVTVPVNFSAVILFRGRRCPFPLFGSNLPLPLPLPNLPPSHLPPPNLPPSIIVFITGAGPAPQPLQPPTGPQASLPQAPFGEPFPKSLPFAMPPPFGATGPLPPALMPLLAAAAAPGGTLPT
mmetsp:Transcript_27875/g.74028  ORF Transcript_27875/g.74028 Transcript_27875/m.74028 type:complete len:207 (-) Transcript_27875:428-1048(-)